MSVDNNIKSSLETTTSGHSGDNKVVLIDAYDSFVYVIVQYIGELGFDPVVLRSAPDNISKIEQIDPLFIILGPGPGAPEDSGHVELIDHFQHKLPILGVCLGLQAIGVAYGAVVSPAAHIMHGKNSLIEHNGTGVFSGFPQPASVTRYHSLVIDESSLPSCLEVTARSVDDHYIMGVKHRELAIEGVQFHPESIGTVDGLNYLSGFIHAHVPR